jgi:hypothetical protein
MGEVPAAASDFFTWDDRAQAWRTPGHAYRDIMTALGKTPVRDEAAGFLKLELGYAQEV